MSSESASRTLCHLDFVFSFSRLFLFSSIHLMFSLLAWLFAIPLHAVLISFITTLSRSLTQCAQHSTHIHPFVLVDAIHPDTQYVMSGPTCVYCCVVNTECQSVGTKRGEAITVLNQIIIEMHLHSQFTCALIRRNACS